MGIQPHDSEPFIPTALPTCPQWCEGGHGREDCGADADGLHHFGEGAGFWLYDIVNTALGTRIMRAGGYEVDLCLQQVDQWSGGNRGSLLVNLGCTMLRADDDGTIHRGNVKLPTRRPAEARSVAAALLSLADQAEGLS